MGIRVVTDSSSDLSPGVVEDLSIEVVPLKVRFGDEEIVDRGEITAEAFWARVRASDVVAQTAAPSPGDFEQAFAKVLAEGASAIVCVTLPSKVSATYQQPHWPPSTSPTAAPRRSSIPCRFPPA